MADIELVIKIPSEVYENIISATADDNDISSLLLGIHEATPLPKGHGRLIDADALMEYCQNNKSKVIDCNDIARFPTITERWKNERVLHRS